MKVILIFTGKTSDEYLRQGLLIYTDRLKHYFPLEIRELNPPKLSQSIDNGQIRVKESNWVMNNLPATDYLVLLDETGKQLTSTGLADFMQARMNQGIRTLAFLIGGAYGVSDDIRKRADFVLALSEMTFTHQMSRIILAEQLYRAMTILKREPYHNP